MVDPKAGHSQPPFSSSGTGVGQPGTTPRTDVLVVEDNAALRSTMVEIIEAAGYSVSEAEDGAVALDRLAAMDVGMILLDIKMPRVDGLRFLELAIDPPPVVVVSANYRDAINTPSGGDVFMFLHKPVPPSELLGAIKLALLNR